MVKAIVGHRVYAEFDHYDKGDDKRFKSGIVVSVDRRFGKMNNGQDYSNPLVKIVDEYGKPDHFDESFIIKREKPSKYVDYSAKTFNHINKPLISCDYLRNEVKRLLTNQRKASVPAINYNLMHMKAYDDGLFFTFGIFAKPRSKKRLRKWVKQNINRFIQSKKEVDNYMTRSNMEDEMKYWNDVENDLMDAWDEIGV